jgi:hypothetical protein
MTRCAALLACVLAASSAMAQSLRTFPANALRGEMVFGPPPEVLLNRTATQLAPGARIRDESNRYVLSGSVQGTKRVVHYTLDLSGQPLEIWLLTPTELANKPWPVTPEQVQSWHFDAATQTWTQP